MTTPRLGYTQPEWEKIREEQSKPKRGKGEVRYDA
jgi:hypothetical protein